MSKRAKRSRLTVNPVDGLVVVLPHGRDQSCVPRMLKENFDWLLDNIEHITAPTAPAIRDGATVLFQGEQTPIHIEHLDAGAEHSTLNYRDGAIYLALHPSHRDTSAEIFEKWLRAYARSLITEAVLSLDPEGRFPFKRLYIRNQKTKWGSCSNRGNLSFNCRLAMAPPFVLRYIVAHELAHLKELNHSQRFWEIVEDLYGDCEKPERWLEENGAQLNWR
jgi:predicted metal-dependent hydrolase